MDYKIIAVDFDGTLCENKWPEIGEANLEMIAYLKERQAAGDKLILWTCRKAEILENAINWSKEQGIIFDAVNENLPEVLEWMGGDSRKIFADEYIDDRNAWLPSEEIADILYLCDGKQCGETCPSTECKHTSDISHAKNFMRSNYNSYWEKEKKIEQISENMSQSERLELWGSLIDVVEDWLEEKGITANDIPNEEREDTEDAAIIYGSDYDYLADRFAAVVGISRDTTEKMSEHKKAKECIEFLKNYCKSDSSNCTIDCLRADKDYALDCILGGRQIYPCEWKIKQKEWNKKIIKFLKIIVPILFFILLWCAYIFSMAMPIPHTKCEWYYNSETIITDCGYKITDGCPNCGRKIEIISSHVGE